MTDRYTRAVLTVIAAALVYLCILQTPIPTASAQGALRPGEPTPPLEVIVVGWRPGTDVSDGIPVSVVTDVRVAGVVQTEQRETTTSRVTIVGWEEGGADRARGTTRRLAAGEPGIPVNLAR